MKKVSTPKLKRPQNSLLPKIFIVLVAIFALIGLVILTVNYFGDSAKRPIGRGKFKELTKPRVINEQLLIPDTQKIIEIEGRSFAPIENKVEVPLVPLDAGDEVVVPQAKLTIKGAYELANKKALSWSAGAELSFIKSLGTVTLEGKSSQWQAVFFIPKGSSKSYEIIIQEDKIVSAKAVSGNAVGEELPGTWFDSGEALKRLAEMPQFEDCTIYAIGFAYDTDGKKWRYAVATNLGITSLEL